MYRNEPTDPRGLVAARNWAGASVTLMLQALAWWAVTCPWWA